MEFKFKVGDMVKHISPFAKPQRVTGVHRINGWNFLTFHEALPKQSELFAEDTFELSDASTAENERFLGLNTTKPETINLRKVDFPQLRATVKHISEGNRFPPTQEELANLALFFQMLGKSSSFAHLAHKKFQQ